MAAIAAFALLGCALGRPAPTRTTTNGVLAGNALGNADEFLGIPFGVAGRFEPAQLFNGSYDSTPLDARAFGPACLQDSGLSAYGAEHGCLVANVWAPPGATASSGLPVIGFVFGGNFDFDEAEPYNMSELAAAQNAVAFSFNYRVGPLGFLAFKEDVDAKVPTGNWGMTDMITALKWVKREIAVFGGDPTKLAIFGQSSGASAVATLTLMPAANGLFRGSICESGGPYARSIEDALEATRYVGLRVGCLFPTRECLSKVNASKLVMRQEDPEGTSHAPCIDGHLIPDDPETLLEEGKFNDVHILWGSNTNDSMRDIMEASCGHRDEGAPPVESCEKVSEAQYIRELNYSLSSEAALQRALQMYPPDPAGQDNLFREGWWKSERFNCGTRRRVRTAVQSGGVPRGGAFLYRFDHWFQSSENCTTQYNWHDPRYGTMHADEVSFTVGQPTFMFVGYTNCSAPGWSGYDVGCTDCSYDADEAAFAHRIGRFWTNMAATGDPNCRTLPGCNSTGAAGWPSFVPETEEGVVLRPVADSLGFPTEREPSVCAFWDAEHAAAAAVAASLPANTRPADAGEAPAPPNPNILGCTSAHDHPSWPTYHAFNNVSVEPGPNGKLKMRPLNDANAIFLYKGIYHLMMQAGGGIWTHSVSNDLTRWYHLIDALGSGGPNITFPDKGPCDGSLSFPDLGAPPYNGSTPVIIYDADCGAPLPKNETPPSGPFSRHHVPGDVARLEVARPHDPTDPYLTRWEKTVPGPVSFDGLPCAFPSRVWKSEIGDYWNMLCDVDGEQPWARYTSDSPSLMRWKLADRQFTRPIPIGGYDFTNNGIMFHPIPNGPPGGPTHFINGNYSGRAGDGLAPPPGGFAGAVRHDAFYLGTYDPKAEVMHIDLAAGPQLLESGVSWTKQFPIGTGSWAVAGPGGGDRLITVGWLSDGPCRSFGSCGQNYASLIRELTYDRAAGQLVSRPVAEYEALRNATFVANRTIQLPPGAVQPVVFPVARGGAIDVVASFDVGGANRRGGGFGIALRAGADGIAGADIVLSFVAGPADSNGTRLVQTNGTGTPAVVPAAKVLRGETFDVRVLIDRPVAEVFLMNGRVAFIVTTKQPFSPAKASVHLFNTGTLATAASAVSVYGMGCGWASSVPSPARP